MQKVLLLAILSFSLGQRPLNLKSVNFVKELLETENLLPCSLLLFQDKGDNRESVEDILGTVNTEQRSYFSVKFAENNEMRLPPLKFPPKVGNHHKRSDPCLVVILFVEDTRPAFMKQIYNLLTPVHTPITQKDLDYYIFLSPPKFLDTLLLMNELPARIKFKVGVAHNPLTNLEALVIKTVCFFCNNGQPKILKLHQTFDQSFNYFPDLVWNLHGRVLEVSTPYTRAGVEADPPWVGVNNARRGIWKNLLEEYLNLKFNFSYHLFPSSGKDGQIGSGGSGLELPNGTWIGVVGDLISRKADLGVVTAQTDKRIKVIGFTEAFFDLGYLTFVTAEGAKIYSPAALLWPFDLFMWFCIFLSVLVAFVFFFGIIKITSLLRMKESNFTRRGMMGHQMWSVKYQIQFVTTSFLDQDCVLPTSPPLRIFVAVWLFFTLVLTTIYRSKLVSLLAFPIIETLPATFEDLAFSSYKVGFMKHGDSAYNTLKASTDPVYLKLVKEMEVINGVGLECLEKVVTQRYGCIGYDFSIKHLVERNLSEGDTLRLVHAKGHTYNVYLGLATEGRSILMINFSKYLSYTRPFHLQYVWAEADWYYNVRLLKREWWKATNQTDKALKTISTEDDGDNLTLKHISGAFLVLGILDFVSACFFTAELAIGGKKRNFINKKALEIVIHFIKTRNQLKPDQLVYSYEM